MFRKSDNLTIEESCTHDVTVNETQARTVESSCHYSSEPDGLAALNTVADDQRVDSDETHFHPLKATLYPSVDDTLAKLTRIDLPAPATEDVMASGQQLEQSRVPGCILLNSTTN
ncbi:hypothetical protein AnigIFM49718_003423 [Aspergillus niger]|nr:hypothetical protein AnigIFM49718_003423 [Aspergillus niger]